MREAGRNFDDALTGEIAEDGVEDARAILPATTARTIVDARDAALACMERAIAVLLDGWGHVEAAQEFAQTAHGGVYSATNHRDSSALKAIFKPAYFADSPEKALEAYRRDLDSRAWTHLMDLTDMRRMMDRTAIEEFEEGLAGDVPPFTIENIEATVKGFQQDGVLIFQRGVAAAFANLDRAFKSNDPWKIARRFVFTYANREHGFWGDDPFVQALMDVERVFGVLSGKPYTPLIERLRAYKRGRYGISRFDLSNEFFRAKGYLNGNIHLWFTDQSLVDEVNGVLAEFYGNALADAVPKDTPASKCTALARNLAFYATPPDAARAALFGHHDSIAYRAVDGRVLEPSAGEGGLVVELLREGVRAGWRSARIDMIEVNPDRIRALERNVAAVKQEWWPGGSAPETAITQANFLQVKPQPIYDAVVMNPPFNGVHWMDHVKHAWEFVKPGGMLKAILPITAELGTSKKHAAFKRWVDERKHPYRGAWNDLPMESFAASGTRINTVTLTLYKQS